MDIYLPLTTKRSNMLLNLVSGIPLTHQKALAHVCGQMCNYTQLGGQVGLGHKTASRYISVFEQMFLLKRVDVWASNRLKRVVKTPKLQFIDSGLLATLVDLTPGMAGQNRSRFGNVLETFVYSELLKHATNSEGDYQLFYYRDHDQYEVDVVAENAGGQLVGVEIKASATIKESDLRGLKRLISVAKNQFMSGSSFTMALRSCRSVIACGLHPFRPYGGNANDTYFCSYGGSKLSDRQIENLLSCNHSARKTIR